MEPGNPYSFATNITMKTINKPDKAVVSSGIETQNSIKEIKRTPKIMRDILKPEMSHRLSVRNTSLDLARGSIMSEMSFNNEGVPVPKFHHDYFHNPTKKEELDNHAAWISFILFEESKKMERLAQLEDEDEEELSLSLRKRST